MYPRPCHAIAALLFLATSAASSFAVETQRQYLSGKGNDDAVPWDFMCTASGGTPTGDSKVMNADKWSTIKVPSNWELQGFGVYTYGRDTYRGAAGWPHITGHYKRTFTVPAGWNGSRIFIHFDGSMTDTQVMVNGKSAGAMHQGGYYEFKYDITDLLKAGDNLLEVTVDDESANASVNSAERRGDYWNYGGIFRPVYLEAVPAVHIDRVAIDAKADGSFNIDVVLPAMPEQNRPYVVKAQVLDAAGQPFGAAMSAPVASATTHLSAQFASPKLWNAETPNLYTLQVSVGDHSVNQKFGFRTIEARAGEGLFVNGQRIMLKGADRHSFWPDSGRALSDKINEGDLALMKEMNMNAVRMSHYPPDVHFLDKCDEMGMYVLDELAGWHAKYDDATGHRLVGEMLSRDVNHPCILFWDNGNEGGWNTNLDDDFAKWDPQKRGVIHPQATFRGLDNTHYPQYNAVVQKSAGNLPFFPTEMLHGLYDGGAGAGLEDYWNVMTQSKVASGGFIWAFLDEDVKRTDKGGILDSKTNQAPDGIVGPNREKEGSFYAIKQIWSPIMITQKGGEFAVENRYAFLDAKDCSYTYELWKYKSPGEPGAGHTITTSIKLQVDSIAPGKSGTLLPPRFAQAPGPYDATAITVRDPGGHELWTYVWPSELISDYRKIPDPKAAVSATASDSNGHITATAGDLVLVFDKSTGLLASATRAGKNFSLVNGPRFVSQSTANAAPARGGAAPPPAPTPVSKLTAIDVKVNPATNDVLIAATYEGSMKSINYTLHANGWLTIDYAYSLTGDQDFFGVGFDYPEANVQSMRYLGNGPYRVWKNRLAGGTLNVWDKKYNNTITGDPDDLAPGAKFDYPEFKGYYAGVKWIQFTTTEGPITALLNTDDLYLQVFTPKFPPTGQQGQAGVNFPKAGISFLHAIPPIGSKFVGPKSSGPMGQPNVAQGEYKGSISLYFGALTP